MATAGQEPVYWVFLLMIGGIPVYVVATRGKGDVLDPRSAESRPDALAKIML